MIRYHADPPLEIAGHRFRVISQVQTIGSKCGDAVFFSGSKQPAAVVFYGDGKNSSLQIADSQVDEAALRDFLADLSVL